MAEDRMKSSAHISRMNPSALRPPENECRERERTCLEPWRTVKKEKTTKDEKSKDANEKTMRTKA